MPSPDEGTELQRVHIQGAGRLGTSLADGLRQRGLSVTLRPARQGIPVECDAQVVILAVRDEQLPVLAARWADGHQFPRQAVALHVAGALTTDELRSLRPRCRGVGQWHPMVALAGRPRPLDWSRVHVLVGGDDAARTMGVQLADALGARTHQARNLDRTLYHAGAALLAGGTVSLMSAAQRLLEVAGLAAPDAKDMLLSLLFSVVENLACMDTKTALTGPVRRGDVTTMRKHLDEIDEQMPAEGALYAAVLVAQAKIADDLAEMDQSNLERVRELLSTRRQST